MNLASILSAALASLLTGGSWSENPKKKAMPMPNDWDEVWKIEQEIQAVEAARSEHRIQVMKKVLKMSRKSAWVALALAMALVLGAVGYGTRYEFIRPTGTGSYGTVYRTNRWTGQTWIISRLGMQYLGRH